MEIVLVSVERHMKRADGPQQTMGQRPVEPWRITADGKSAYTRPRDDSDKGLKANNP